MFLRDVVKNFKLQLESLSLYLKKKEIPKRVVQHCNRSPREVTDAPHLDTFKACLNKR